MPEMPEVETIRRDLSPLVSAKITELSILSPKTASHSAAFFKKALSGQRLLEIRRRGKLLIFSFANGWYLLVHLKMTGQLIYESKKTKIVGGHSLASGSYEKSVGGRLPNKHTRAIFDFNSGGRLYFNDLRKFGYLKLAKREELEKILKNNYGPEPLSPEFSVNHIRQILNNKKTNIKAALLNQKIIAGLGNIYVDEALFAAKINPRRIANKLSLEESAALVKEANKLIRRAIANRGTTFSNYVDSKGRKGNFSRLLKVYGRRGENCVVCGRQIVKVKLAGRGTHFCPYCQK